jgi:hypothetical protein
MQQYLKDPTLFVFLLPQEVKDMILKFHLYQYIHRWKEDSDDYDPYLNCWTRSGEPEPMSCRRCERGYPVLDYLSAIEWHDEGCPYRVCRYCNDSDGMHYYHDRGCPDYYSDDD